MELNDEQIAFVNSSGNVTLCACPGSGKTTSIINKVHKLLKDDNWHGSGIALLSFTNIASDEIERKYVELTGASLNKYPHYNGTIDSFFNLILQRFGYLSLGNNPSVILNPNLKFIGRLTHNCHSKCFSNDNRPHINIEGKVVNKDKEINCSYVEFYSKPCVISFNLLKKHHVIDQGNVAYELYKLLTTHKEILEIVSARFPLIIVDEAQDTNSDLMKIFDLFLEAGIKINFVGDPDQAIFEWNGANPKLFIEKTVDKRFTHLRLLINNRSSQPICDATRVFSKQISPSDTYVSRAVSNNMGLKPKLLLTKKLDENNNVTEEGEAELLDKFLSLCRENNIEINHKTVAIVKRSVDMNSNLESNIWSDSYITPIIANASYEFYYGNRTTALRYCQDFLFILLQGKDKICTEEDIINYNIGKYSFKDLSLYLLRSLINVDIPLKDWFSQTQHMLINFIDLYKLKLNIDFEKEFKMKKRPQIKDFADVNLIDYFKTTNNAYKYGTIHSVKGETYDALLLIIKTRKGSTLTPNTLIKKSDGEFLRLAYVAMTRPRILLAVGMMYDNSIEYDKAFNKQLWDYIEIES